MQYNVRALSPDNVITCFPMDARDEDDARRQIEDRGLLIIELCSVRHSALPFSLTSPLSKRPHLSLVLFSQELVALLNAGLTIVESLEALLEKDSEGRSQTILPRLLAGLHEGKRFSAVLAEQPAIFPPLYVGIIKAAEGTSDLPLSLTRFIDYQQRIDIVRNKIISASIYPLILLCVGSAVTLFLIGYVVPRFAAVYQGTGRSLPWLSQVLLSWGELLSTHTSIVLSCIGIGISLLALMLRSLFAQGGLMRFLTKLPGIGEHIRIYELSRLYLTLGMLLAGGISIITAINTVQNTVSENIRTRLKHAKETIETGTPLSSAFEANHLTTPISLRMLRVGERSGDLGQMLIQSATFYDAEISRWIDRFTRIFEPLLMVVIGVVIGVIVVLLYMPIFDLAGSLS